MRRIGLAVVLGLSLSLAFQGSEAQQPQKMPRLCFLTFDPPKASRFDPFFQRLRELGYVEGQTIAIDYLSAEGQGDRFPALAAECLRRKADNIVVTTTPAAQDLPAAFDTGARGAAEGVLTTAESIFVVQRNRVVQLAAQHKLPALYPYRAVVDAGGLMAYESAMPDLLARTAAYVDRILKGAKPADLPVEQPTKFDLVINLKTAKALGLTIPQTLLLRADQIIE
jgi:ABC-type uncharacterized transport system substrate-binding protein